MRSLLLFLAGAGAASWLGGLDTAYVLGRIEALPLPVLALLAALLVIVVALSLASSVQR